MTRAQSVRQRTFLDESRALVRLDPRFRPLVKAHGPVVLRGPTPPLRRFESLAESIAYQQLNGTAAATIWGRVRALVAGPSPLRAATVESPDIRAGMAMLLAAMSAKGQSTINNAGQIERGYERIDERLNALGARITRLDDRRR